MHCTQCGKELPLVGKFCPFCGAPVPQMENNRETEAFTPAPGQTPIDTAAFDAARQEEETRSAPPTEETQVFSGNIPTPPETPLKTKVLFGEVPTPPPAPKQRRPQPQTTYYDAPVTDTPYNKPSAGKKFGIALLVILLIAAIGTGVYFFVRSQRPDENLTAAEKYMEKGNYDDALTAYQAALATADDTTAIQLQITLLTDFQQAQDYLEQGEYAQALALLHSLADRIPDKTSLFANSVDELISQTETASSEASLAADIAQAGQYLTDNKLEQAAALIDTLESTKNLTSAQQSEIKKLRDQLTTAQESEKRKQETEKQQEEARTKFKSRLTEMQEFDKQLDTAPTTEDMLAATKSSYDEWELLLNDVYDYLESTMTAEAYAQAEQAYNDWVGEREKAAKTAADAIEDPNESTLAALSIRQSYTKTRCQTLIDQI